LVEAPRGTKNIDALSRDGERYSIKTLQSAKKTGTIYPDPEDRERQLFEFIAIAMLNDELCLERLVVLSWDQFCLARSWDKRMSAWYVARSERALAHGKQIFPACPSRGPLFATASKMQRQAMRVSINLEPESCRCAELQGTNKFNLRRWVDANIGLVVILWIALYVYALIEFTETTVSCYLRTLF
jgi:hypothetical protein